MSICARYTPSKDDADDMLNVGFLKILSNISKYRPEIPFGVWMRRVMINCIIDEYRKNKKHKSVVVYVDEYSNNVSLDDLTEDLQKIDTEDIYKLIAQLPNVTRQVFNLYVLDEYSHKEVADKLAIAEGTSKWHLNEARVKLKEMITLLSQKNKPRTI